ncbi:MAG: hypothetical protein AB1813_00290 [Verrucomicrobiota bacterium]|jgi:hypothetical protein
MSTGKQSMPWPSAPDEFAPGDFGKSAPDRPDPFELQKFFVTSNAILTTDT